MPVMPASASAVITALALQRTTHSLVSVRKLSMGGWLIWTPMKMAPAAAAQRPAAGGRGWAVMFMSRPLGVRCRAGVSGDERDVRDPHGEATSPRDVTGVVI